jgi:phosphonopyruvate decarboxylase
MIEPKDFYYGLFNSGVNFFCGVPDSLLKGFCEYIQINLKNDKHIIAANEGSAISIAAGYGMARNEVPLVYLQNSGLGNAINPLLSLADPTIYSIPMLILVGWRGEPGIKDEPQHTKQGEVMLEMIKSMKYSYIVLPSEPIDVINAIEKAVNLSKSIKSPVFLIARKDLFLTSKEEVQQSNKSMSSLSRERAIEIIIEEAPRDTIFIATTGKISRELYELRIKHNHINPLDFLTVGSMGHASQIALGFSIGLPNKNIICLDGDGSVLMHMGGLAIIGTSKVKNYLHIVLNNGMHESVGGYPTVAFEVSLKDIACGCKYTSVTGGINDEDLLKNALENNFNCLGPAFIEVIVKSGSRKNLGRPIKTPYESKLDFLKVIKN